MPFSTYFKNLLRDAIFRGGVDVTAYSTLYFGLLLTSGSEVSGGSYARVAVTSNTTNFNDTGTGTSRNQIEITFPTPTTDWGTVNRVVAYDASTGGNEIFVSDTFSDAEVITGVAPKISVDSLSISV